jgi:hypothetical protein
MRPVSFQDFLLKARRKDAKSVKIKKNADNTKFKVTTDDQQEPNLLVLFGMRWETSLLP